MGWVVCGAGKGRKAGPAPYMTRIFPRAPDTAVHQLGWHPLTGLCLPMLCRSHSHGTNIGLRASRHRYKALAALRIASPQEGCCYTISVTTCNLPVFLHCRFLNDDRAKR